MSVPNHIYYLTCSKCGTRPWVSAVNVDPFVCHECEVRAEVAEAMRAACITAVEALEPRLDMDKYKGGYDCCGCSTPADLYVDALNALREVQP